MSETLTEKKASPILLSQGALNELNRIISEQNIPASHGLRIGVKGGGCSGFSYILGFDVMKENDTVYDFQGLTLFIQKAHALYLLGMEIDFVEGLDNRGFSFSNPNATETCGCGTSFNA
jgi:iron-sulfur cluster assembly protein